MIVDHLNDLQQVVLLQTSEGVRHLLNIEGLLLILAKTIHLTLAIIIRRQGASLTQKTLERLTRVLEGDLANGIVRILLEVEIVLNGAPAALVGVVHLDGHLEFTPSLIFAGKWSLGEGCETVRKT